MKKSTPILLNSEGLWYANNRLDLAVILAEKNCKILLCRKRYLQKKMEKYGKRSANISGYKNDREIDPVILHIKNPLNSTKWVTTFS